MDPVDQWGGIPKLPRIRATALPPDAVTSSAVIAACGSDKQRWQQALELLLGWEPSWLKWMKIIDLVPKIIDLVPYK